MDSEVSSQNKDIISKLDEFHSALKSFKSRLGVSSKIKGYRLNQDKLRERLVREAGQLKPIVIELTGKEYIRQFNQSYNIWDVGLTAHRLSGICDVALDYCIDAVNEAIGKLKSDIQIGIRDEQGNLIDKLQLLSSEPPKAFISHGKESAALNKLEEFLRTLGIEPLIAKEQPSLDKTVDGKVEYYLDQADLVVVLATGDDKIGEKLHPRQNVIHEIGLAQKTHAGRIIYLLEQGAEFPSNISPKVWERFKQRNMLSAFLCIVRELRAYGILKAVKP